MPEGNCDGDGQKIVKLKLRGDDSDDEPQIWLFKTEPKVPPDRR